MLKWINKVSSWFNSVTQASYLIETGLSVEDHEPWFLWQWSRKHTLFRPLIKAAFTSSYRVSGNAQSRSRIHYTTVISTLQLHERTCNQCRSSLVNARGLSQTWHAEFWQSAFVTTNLNCFVELQKNFQLCPLDKSSISHLSFLFLLIFIISLLLYLCTYKLQFLILINIYKIEAIICTYSIFIKIIILSNKKVYIKQRS